MLISLSLSLHQISLCKYCPDFYSQVSAEQKALQFYIDDNIYNTMVSLYFHNCYNLNNCKNKSLYPNDSLTERRSMPAGSRFGTTVARSYKV